MSEYRTDQEGRAISDDGNHLWDGEKWRRRTKEEIKDHAAADKQKAHEDAWRTRQGLVAELQQTCPLPIDPQTMSLPGGLNLFPDEFCIAVGRDWGLSSQRLILTTHRLIHTHGRMSKDQQTVYLTDIRDVGFKKPAFTYGTLAIETAGGHSIEGLPQMKNGQAIRDQLLTMVHWARQRAQQAATPAATPSSAPPPDRYDQLRKLGELKEAGLLSDTEFEAEKAKVLAG
jgi:hypothetical protein